MFTFLTLSQSLTIADHVNQAPFFFNEDIVTFSWEFNYPVMYKFRFFDTSAQLESKKTKNH